MKLYLPLLVGLLLQPQAANAQFFDGLFDLLDAIFCPFPLLNFLLCNECNYLEPACKNEGVCTDGFGAFTCECPAPWGGDTCEVDNVDGCASTPCKNGGTCTDEVDGFTCQCPAPWGGDTCEDDLVDGCDSTPCKNGGTCTDEVDGFTCVCADGWKGETCEEDENECDTNPCIEESEVCENTPGSFDCVCAPGFTPDDDGVCQKDGETAMLLLKGVEVEATATDLGNGSFGVEVPGVGSFSVGSTDIVFEGGEVDGVTPGFTIPFPPGTESVITSDGAFQLATFVLLQLQAAAEISEGSERRLDSPGCDLFPDTSCNLGCCAVHDQCYDINECNALSWARTLCEPSLTAGSLSLVSLGPLGTVACTASLFFISGECSQCNTAVVG